MMPHASNTEGGDFMTVLAELGEMRRFAPGASLTSNELIVEQKKADRLQKAFHRTATAKLPTPHLVLEIYEQAMRLNNETMKATFQLFGLSCIIRVRQTSAERTDWTPKGLHDIYVARQKRGTETAVDINVLTLISGWIPKSGYTQVNRWLELIESFPAEQRLEIFNEHIKPHMLALKEHGLTIAAETAVATGIRAMAPVLSELTDGAISVEAAAKLLCTLPTKTDFAHRLAAMLIILNGGRERFLRTEQ